MTTTEHRFTFRVRNTGRGAVPCVNCRRTVAARTTHICEAFTAERAIVSEETIGTGFCHCLGFFRGSDHCQCCGCEEHESTCDHICDGTTCTTEHDSEGRAI